MNNSLYEDYMRSVLGYSPVEYQNTYDTNYNNYNTIHNRTNFEMQELEKCYPDIYVLVYPMVQKACMNNTRQITRELIDDMTKEIYFSIEDNEIGENRGKEQNINSKEDIENRTMQIKNRTLNDLIRILILRELLGRPGNMPGRPPRPRPPRPRPPQPQPPRPPMRPLMPRVDMRGYNIEQYDIFENDYNLLEY